MILYMHYLLESFFVGIYCVLLYIPINAIFHDWFGKLFVFGFMKHWFGSFIQLHDYYCNHGDACISIYNIVNNDLYYDKRFLVLESIIEGLYFFVIVLLLYTINRQWKKYPYSLFIIFILGMMTHIFAEWIGLHKYACRNNCKQII